MVDYRFRCILCGKINFVETTGDYPEIGSAVKCINCNEKIKVKNHGPLTLEVKKFVNSGNSEVEDE